MDLSSLIVNDQHKLHNAIQEIPSNMEETIDSDSDNEFQVQSSRSTMTSISSLLSNNTNYDMLLERLASPMTINTHSNNISTTTTNNSSNNSNTNITTKEQFHRHSSISTTSTTSSSSSYVKNIDGEVDWGK